MKVSVIKTLKNWCTAARAFCIAAACCMVGTAASSAGAAPGDYHRHYFDEQQPLQLDPVRIAVYQSEPNDVARDRAIRATGLEPAAAESFSIRGWSLVTVPAGMRQAADVEALVGALAGRQEVDFVSPVFVDDFGGPLIVTRDLLVGFHEGVPNELAAAVLNQVDPGVIAEADWAQMPGAYRIAAHAKSGFDVLEASNTLASRAEVAWAEPDMIFTGRHGSNDAPFFPNDPFFDDLWGVHNTGQTGGTANMDMDGPEAWGITTGSSSVRVLIIDDGVQSNHPDLNLTLGTDLTSDGSPQGNPDNECDNHGTAVAGCVSAIINNSLGVAGIAPDVRSVAARTFISNTPCDGGWTSQGSWTVDALTYAENNNVSITNNSNSYGFTSSAIETKYQQTRNDGMVHFASAGNGGNASLAYPASLSTVVGVAALDHNGNRAGFSQYGTGLGISAPGVNIWTTDRTGSDGYVNGDYTSVNGTSFASPYTAGVAALVRSVNQGLNAFDVEDVLFASAVDLGPAGYDTDFGWGFVNARNAVEAAQGEACGSGAGNCYENNGTPGCSDTDCCTAVCARDPFCCNSSWDGICANTAFSTCGNCGASSAGFCDVDNGTPGCNVGDCCETVCIDDPFCCNASWDGLCADNAVENCSSCGFSESGNCYESNGTPGCDNVDCCSTVCDSDPFCCDTNWDTACANSAFELCGNCGGEDAGSCFESNGSPGCNNSDCCAAVCVDDPFCCNTTWDSFCATDADQVCAGCGGVAAGSCFEANGTPACDDENCCEGVCALDPFCCDTDWDGLCADSAIEECDSCGGSVTGSCFESNGSAYCDNADCCNDVCAIDPFCCDTNWDIACANQAEDICSCPGDLDNSLEVNVDDLLIVLNNWGSCPGGTPGCDGDANDDGDVNVDDLLIVLNNWGACP